MKRYFFRWFVPVILLLAMIAAAMFYYRSSVRRYAFDLEFSKVYGEIEHGLGESELVLKTITDANYGVAMSLPLLDFQEDGGVIATLLSNHKKNKDAVTSVMAVNDQGIGYDDQGKRVDISDLILFREVTENYTDGGAGLLLINDDIYNKGSVAAINSISFKDGKKGFLITIVFNKDMKEQLFGNIPPVFHCHYITLEGRIIVSNSDDGHENFAEKVWTMVPENISPDVIKLSIVQKKVMMSEVEGGGCLLVIPSNVANGAVIAMASEEEMNMLIMDQMMEYYKFCLQIAAAVVIYVFLCILLLLFIRHVRRRRLAAFDEKSRRDPLTGVYSKDGVVYEIDKYIQGSSMKAGILFVVRVENFTRLRSEKGDTEADKNIAAFTDRFTMEFRVTDIVGRIGDDEYYAFLKDIKAEKDIRKQIDEMQLLLHDIREERAKDGDTLVAYAGCARYPGNGSNAKELMEYSKNMMEKAREEGASSFYSNNQKNGNIQ